MGSSLVVGLVMLCSDRPAHNCSIYVKQLSMRPQQIKLNFSRDSTLFPLASLSRPFPALVLGYVAKRAKDKLLSRPSAICLRSDQAMMGPVPREREVTSFKTKMMFFVPRFGMLDLYGTYGIAPDTVSRARLPPIATGQDPRPGIF